MLTRRGAAASIGFALLVFQGVALPGCVAPKAIPVVPPRPLRAATLEEVLAAYDGYCKGIESISASGDLEVRDLRAGKAGRLGVRLVAKRGGRLYLKASVTVVTALELSADGERFSFQVPRKKTVWTGAADAPPRAEDDKAPYYALRPLDIVSALLPDPLIPAEGDALVLEGDREAFSLTLARLSSAQGTARRGVSLSRDTLQLSRARTFDERGNVVSEATFGDWEGGNPRRVLVARPREGYEAAFAFDKIERNVAIPERAFAPRIPEGYTVIEVDKP